MDYNKYKTIKFAILNNYKDCLIDFNSLVINEGYIGALPVFRNNEVALNADKVEHKVSSVLRRAPLKSMDCVCVINRGLDSDSKLLLIEFRFNYVNLRNLKKQDLFQKVAGTSSAFSSSNIFPKYYFIFNSSLKFQAIRRFRNMVPSMPNAFVATDLTTLISLHFT